MNPTQTTIIQLCPRLNSGGIERGTVDLAIALKKSGFNSIVISGGGFLENELRENKIQHICMPIYSKNPFKFIANLFHLNKVLNDLKPKLVVPYSRIPSWLVYFLASRQHYLWISNCNGIHSIDKLGLKKIYNAVLTKGQVVIANSEYTKNYLVSNYHTPANKIKVIYRGVDLDRFNPKFIDTQKIDDFKKQCGIPENKIALLLPARFAYWKGQSVFIEACHLLKDKFHLDFMALLVGNTKNKSYLDHIQSLINRYQLKDEIKIFGESSEMTKVYAIADLVISSSIEPEAFGRTVIEAQSMLKPVIATQHGGACETIDNGKTGWLYSPLNAKELAELIYKVTQLPEDELNKVIDEAAKQVKLKFSKEHMCQELINLYRELL